ncbi:hypothetical protein DPSP01_003584 [Paraphaeosphaeria sporulosa]
MLTEQYYGVISGLASIKWQHLRHNDCFTLLRILWKSWTLTELFELVGLAARQPAAGADPVLQRNRIKLNVFKEFNEIANLRFLSVFKSSIGLIIPADSALEPTGSGA